MSRRLLLALALFSFGCSGSESIGPSTGSLEITASTTGADLDPDGYTVAIHGGGGRSLAGNGTVTLSQLSVGDHTLVLSGLAANCTLSGQNPRTVSVSAGTTAQTVFQIACVALTATLEVNASTTGPADLDPDGYTVAVDGGAEQPLAINGAATWMVKAGSHTVTLSGVAANCTVTSPNPVTVTVAARDSVQTAFQISCGLLTIRPIAFSSNRNNSTNIYAMNADGSGVVQLTYSSPDYRLRDYYPAWSPDGTKIAFWSTRDGDYWEVWAINADGTALTRLTTSPQLFFDPTPIVWSPDGKRMAPVFGGEIYVLSADGLNLVNITNNATADGGPTWSPDGSKIAFWTQRDGNSEIYVMNADGSNPVNLTNNPATDNLPAWSPDGTKIVFVSDRDGSGNFAIYAVNADGSGPAVQLIAPADDYLAPVWSADGRKIAFRAGGDIHVMNADGSNPLNVTNNPPGEVSGSHAWSPDGLTIVFEEAELSGFEGIWVVNVDGSGLKQIAPSGNFSNFSPARRPR